jgi:hypothetical protein
MVSHTQTQTERHTARLLIRRGSMLIEHEIATDDQSMPVGELISYLLCLGKSQAAPPGTIC